LKRTDCVAFSFQGHPEASPGPHDIGSLFHQFVAAMEARLEKNGRQRAGSSAA